MLELKNLRFDFNWEAGRADDIYRGAIKQGAEMLLWSETTIAQTFHAAVKNATAGMDEQRALATEADIRNKFLGEVEKDPRILSFAESARDLYEAKSAAVGRGEWPDLLPWETDALSQSISELENQSDDQGYYREGADSDLDRVLKSEYGFGLPRQRL